MNASPDSRFLALFIALVVVSVLRSLVLLNAKMFMEHVNIKRELVQQDFRKQKEKIYFIKKFLTPALSLFKLEVALEKYYAKLLLFVTPYGLLFWSLILRK